jgi:lysophospholipase L1-like esterase
MRDILRNQLPLATLELEARAPQPVVVTIGGGGNDLVRFVSSPEAASCLAGEADCLPRVDALLGGIEQRFEQALRELRRAGGPGTLILVRTQYNPLYRVGCKTPELRDLADTTLEGSAGSRLERGLNDRLRDVAARQDAKVIEVYALFRAAPDALVGPDCAHPSEAGHAAIFAAAVAAFERATFGPSSGGAATVSSH